MSRGISVAMIALLLAPAGVGAAARKPAPATTKPRVSQLMQSCDAHKFETVVHVVIDGAPHDSKVKLCGVEGQSNADWIRTLRDAIHKLEANKDMESAVRDQIVGAINAEIGRLSIVGSIPPPLRVGTAIPSVEAPLSRDYATLPPIPSPPEAPEAPTQPPADTPLPPARPTPTAPIQRDFAQLPPLPSPPPVSAPATASPAPLPAVAPRLSFGCDTPGDLTSDAPCADFQRETVLTIHARDDVPAGTLLQFVRNDRSQAELPLDGLRRGKTLRTALPAEVCRGFTSGKLELRIVRGEGGSEVLATDGPYSLLC